MELEPGTCSLSRQPLDQDPGENRVLELKASGKTATVCPQCYGAIGDGGDDEFLEFLLSS